MLAFFGGNANDVLTAILIVAVGAVLRGLWSMQQRIARLEGLDEMRERQLSEDRGEEPLPRIPPYDREKNR
jgi:hypothetical protein